jgi:glycosyltransferase involved in cell wall biosynthesis
VTDPSHSTQTPAFLWLGGYEEATGLADEIRGFLRALEARGHEPCVRPFLKPRHQVELLPADRRMVEVQRRREPEAPLVAVHHYIVNQRQIDVPGVANVARVMFETDRMPAAWRDLLLTRDEIWVPCEQNADAFRRGGIPASRIRVLGETIDFDLFAPGAEAYTLRADDGRFVFFSNFDFGERKGWRQLIAAWASAFTADDGVCLVLKTGSYTHGEDYAADRIGAFVRERFGAGAESRMAPIEIVADRLPADRLPGLYAAADAYVLASRGEGWGRPYMEAMAMGLPTIGSRFGGNTDFMNDGNSVLVDGELVPVAEDAELYPTHLTKGHRWFEPDVDALAAALREVAGDPDKARERAAGARTELIERFGTDAIVERLVELGTDILERRARPFACAIRGSFGSNASLALVNDELAAGIERRGRNVIYRGQRAELLTLMDLPGVSHSWPPEFEPVTMGPTVLILPWEYGAPPREWVEQVNARVDRVWVPSEYVRQGFVESGMPPGVVEVVPNGVDLERFTPDGPHRELPGDADCTFLFVGGSIWRKGADLLLAAWAEAFGPDDRVRLVIKDFGTGTHYRGQTAGVQIGDLIARDDVAPVVYMDQDLSPDELAELYRACDVFVTPYRGEGFCLPALEAMACGLPVIHTGSGPTGEFVPAAGGWALPAELAPLREGAQLPELAAPGWVHELDSGALVAALRSAAAGADDRRARGAAAHARAQDFHWDRIAEIAERSLETIAAEALPAARDVGAAELERRGELVLYAPDWADEDSWGPTLERWAAAFGPADDVTLALHLPAGDPAALAVRILARLEAAGHREADLPDLALCEPDSVALASLVAAADAVLVDVAQAERPELCRRARRIVRATADELLDYAASGVGRLPQLDDSPLAERSRAVPSEL